MARRFVPFGEDPADKVVADFLRRKGVRPDDITGYSLRRGVDEIGTLSVDFIYESEPASIPEAPRITTENPNIRRDDGSTHPQYKR